MTMQVIIMVIAIMIIINSISAIMNHTEILFSHTAAAVSHGCRQLSPQLSINTSSSYFLRVTFRVLIPPFTPNFFSFFVYINVTNANSLLLPLQFDGLFESNFTPL